MVVGEAGEEGEGGAAVGAAAAVAARHRRLRECERRSCAVERALAVAVAVAVALALGGARDSAARRTERAETSCSGATDGLSTRS